MTNQCRFFQHLCQAYLRYPVAQLYLLLLLDLLHQVLPGALVEVSEVHHSLDHQTNQVHKVQYFQALMSDHPALLSHLSSPKLW